MESEEDVPIKILVFSKTNGYRHNDSIEAGKVVLEEIADSHGFETTFTEDETLFTNEFLSEFDGIIFLHTTGNIFNENQKSALQAYMSSGGGWLGIHAAADCEGGINYDDWPWYGELLGGNAWFRYHPLQQEATVIIEDPDALSASNLASPYIMFDEWYAFINNPRDDVHVIMSVDESSYDTGTYPMGDHPISWNHEFEGGRSHYIGFGHFAETVESDFFKVHLEGALLWILQQNV